MKILVFTTLFPNNQMPNHGVFVKERIVSLAKLCDVRIIAPVPYFPKLNINKKWFSFSQIPFEENIEGLKVYHPRYFITPGIFRVLYGFFMFLSVFGFVKRIKKEFDFDLIDAHFIYPDGLAAVLLGKALNKKVVVNARGTDINVYPKFKIIRNLISFTLRKANFITAVSENLKESILNLGIENDKVKVVSNGVDAHKFHPVAKEQARKELGLPQGEKIVLSMGNLVEGKGFNLLIDAVSLLKRDDVNLFIIGDGPDKNKLNNRIQKLGLGRKIKLLGTKPHGELYKWYSAADIFCLTSLREGRPNVAVEALACGAPVVSMRNIGLDGLITTDNGVLLNSYHPMAIKGSLEDSINQSWNNLRISATVSHLSWEACVNTIYDIFKTILSRNDILFFSSDDWNSGLTTSKYHLATRLARNNRVFFINSLSLRTPSASARDVKKIFIKLKGFFKGVAKARSNIYVVTPILLPVQKSRIARFLNNIIVALQIKWVLRKFKCENPEIWTFLPNSLGVIRKLPKQKLIYYCVDDMSAFKNVPQKAIDKLDTELTKEADVVFAVSKEIFGKKKELNANTFYSPHGVDFELFNKAITDGSVNMPVDLKNISKPVIGFYGLISGDWIDYNLVRFLAEKRPGWSFVFIGKIDESRDGLPRYKNIHYLPVKPYEELYRYSRFFDVAILPFNINQLTTHAHPLKILEYLSAGKPVVSVNIPEVANYREVIEVALNYEDFLNKTTQALDKNNSKDVKKRIEFAATHSWEKRFDEIKNIIACSR